MLGTVGPCARRVWLPVMLALCLTRLAVGCHPGRIDYLMGFARLGEHLAIYAPMCPDERVSGVRVHSVPDVGHDGDDALLWQAEDPIADSAGAGLVMLGEGFRTSSRPSTPAPGHRPGLA